MEAINIIDPKTGQAHAIPYDQLPNALQAGGQFADEDQKQKAIAIQGGTYGKSSLAPTPFNELQKEIPPAAPKPHKNLTDMIVDKLSNALSGGLSIAGDITDAVGRGAEFVNDIPNKLEKANKYEREHPIKAFGRDVGLLGAAVTNLAKEAFNTPHDLFKYALKKHLAFDFPIPGTDLGFPSDVLPHIPETGLQKALGLEPNVEHGEELVYALPGALAMGAGGASIVKSGAKGINKYSKHVKHRRGLENKIDLSKVAHDLSKEELAALQDALKLQYSNIFKEDIGTVEPVPMRININKKEGKAEALQPQADIYAESGGQPPVKPDTELIIQPKMQAAETARKDLETDLGVKNEPMRLGGEKVQTAIKHVKDTASDLYNAGRKYFVDKQIKADNSAEIKSAAQELETLKNSDELAPGYGHGSAEQKALEENINALKGEMVDASDIFDLQQHFVKMAKEYRNKAFSGVSEYDKTRYLGIADRLNGHADKLAKRLESVGGEEVQAMFKEANKGWRIYSEVKNNTTGRLARKKGKLSESTLTEISYNEPGNEFLRSLTETIPGLKKNMLAAFVGDKNFNKITNPNAVTQKYLDSLPEVQDKLNAYQKALKDVSEGKAEAESEVKKFNELKKAMEGAAKQQKLKNQIKFIDESIPKVEAKISEAKAKGNDVTKLEKELADYKRDRADKTNRLKALGHTLLKVTGMSTIGHKLGF